VEGDEAIAGRQKHTANKVVATQNRDGLAVQVHRPAGMETVIEQQAGLGSGPRSSARWASVRS
jgi:hypothetical protein